MLRNLCRVYLKLPSIGSWTYEPRVGSVRLVNTVGFMKPTYKNQEDTAKEFGHLIKKYCEDTGLDDMGITTAMARGGEHWNDSDKKRRLTISAFTEDAEGLKKMVFQGPDRDWGMLHVYIDEAEWPKPGELILKALVKSTDEDLQDLREM